MELFVFRNKYPQYEVLKYVCPRMQSYCKYILDNIPSGIKKIILFGSALTTACTSYSDIDLVIVVKDKESVKELHNYLGSVDIEVDALTILEEEEVTFLEENKNLSRSLKNRSVVLYES